MKVLTKSKPDSDLKIAKTMLGVKYHTKLERGSRSRIKLALSMECEDFFAVMVRDWSDYLSVEQYTTTGKGLDAA